MARLRTNPVAVEEASLQTVAVQIKALTVGRKQMTLSVFRQLRHRHIVSPSDLELLGAPWGWVNYYWPGCEFDDDSRGRVHLVWSDDSGLWRCCASNARWGTKYLCDGVVDTVTRYLGDPRAVDWIHKSYGREKSAAGDDYVERWNKLLLSLKETGQLFIAV